MYGEADLQHVAGAMACLVPVVSQSLAPRPSSKSTTSLACQVDAAAERQIMADHETMFNLGYHPNIVQLYGVCPATPNNPVMLCMEFMEVRLLSVSGSGLG